MNSTFYSFGVLGKNTLLGTEDFDKIADNSDLKNTLIGLLIKAKQELTTSGFGLTNDNKPKWLEHYKNQGKRFLAEHSQKSKES